MTARILAMTALVGLAFTFETVGFNGNSVEAWQAPSAQAGNQHGSAMPDKMKMHGQMMAEMKAGDARLDALVLELNAAKGDAKVDALVAVVNELVQQQKTMHGRMGQMHDHMMGMMGGHGTASH